MRLPALCALLLAAGIAAYHNSFSGTFHYDDQPNIVDNPGIRSFAAALRDSAPGLRHRPLTRLSLALNYALGGLDVHGYHVFNLLVHLLAGLLLFDLVRRTLLLRTVRSTSDAEARWLAFAVALLWIVHPLQTESVSYITQRLEAMASLFYLACLYGVLRGSHSSRAFAWYAGAVLVCWLGVATKEVLVTAPLVVLLYDRVFLAPSWETVVRRRWAVYAGMLVAVAALAYATIARLPPGWTDMLHERADFPAGFGFRGVSPWEYLSTQPGVILHYLRLALWPACLSIDYSWPVAGTPGEVVWPGLAVVTLLVASLVAIVRWPQIGFLCLTFLLLLAPTSSVMPNAFLAVEHRMYLPLAPVIVLGVLGVDALARRVLPDVGTRRALEAAALGVVGVGLSLRTIQRNRDYRDEIALWSSTIACLPGNARGHFNLGNSLMGAGRIDEAIAELQRAVELQPNFPDARLSLGNAFMIKGDVEQAVAEYERTLRIDPRHAGVHNNLAAILDQRGDTDAAVSHYRRALKGDPWNAPLQANYAGLHARAEDWAGATVRYRKAIRADPSYAPAYLGLGLCLEQQGNTAAAIAALRTATGLAPDLLQAEKELVRLLATAEPKTLRRPGEAVRRGEALVRRNGAADVESLLALATAYAEAGRSQDAIATAERAYQRAVASGEGSEMQEAADQLGRYRAGVSAHP
ncbi:MAG TPA: tetratricopeptide repeat protein [Candidatus Nitrosopolaris sp.]|nr:tetratricopeptide repeat protein [Candidatus Nitrosopolaris sp.]